MTRKFFLFFLLTPIGAAAAQKTVCLNMIVKNESKIIRRCLESVKPLIDYWIIADTGSTDATQEIIQETMDGIPGELLEHPWVNFAHNRNEVLKAAQDKADYVLFIDADEVLAYDPTFRWPNLDKDSYFFNIKNEFNGQVISEYKRTLLINNHIGWKWEGVIHERIISAQQKTSGLMEKIENISRTHDGFRFQDPNKYLNDAKILESALEKEPNDSRYVFYLAVSHFLAQNYEKALDYFQKRISMEQRGTSEEVFQSYYRAGMIQANLDKKLETIIDSFTKAHLQKPTRAEPLFYLASHLMQKGSFLLAELLLKKALELSCPTTELFMVENWIYDWGSLHKYAECAFRMGRLEESKKAIKGLLDRPQLPSAVRNEMENNLKAIERQSDVQR